MITIAIVFGVLLAAALVVAIRTNYRDRKKLFAAIRSREIYPVYAELVSSENAGMGEGIQIEGFGAKPVN